MSYIYTSIELLASFIEIFILYKIYEQAIMDTRNFYSKSMEIIAAIAGTLLIYVCNQISMFSYYTILVFVLFTSLSAYLFYRVSYVILFSISSFYMLCVSGVDFLIFTFISNLGDGFSTFLQLITEQGLARSVLIILIKTIWIIIYYILKRYLYKLSKNRSHIAAVLGISCMGYAGFIFLVRQTFQAFHYSLIGNWFVFLAFLAFIIFVVYCILEYKGEKMKSSFLEMQNQILEDKYLEIHRIYKSNAKLYHDVNNHLNILYQLIEKGNYDTAQTYISEIVGPISRLSIKEWTGIDVIDTIINHKLDRMIERGIVYDINVEYPTDSCIRANDICIILSNLLDNAIEGIEKTNSHEKITLTIRIINKYLFIKVTNPSITINLKNKKLDTTKQDKEKHGWGIRNIQDTAEKYQGTFKYKYENGIFTATVMMLYQTED